MGDPNPQVRAAFAENLSGAAPILGKEATTDHLLPMFLQMLKDDDSKVRLNIISRLELVNAGPSPSRFLTVLNYSDRNRIPHAGTFTCNC